MWRPHSTHAHLRASTAPTDWYSEVVIVYTCAFQSTLLGCQVTSVSHKLLFLHWQWLDFFWTNLVYNDGNSYLCNLANTYVLSGNQPSGKVLLESQFYKWENWGPGSLNNLPQVSSGGQGWEPKVHLIGVFPDTLLQVQACGPPVGATCSCFETSFHLFPQGPELPYLIF